MNRNILSIIVIVIVIVGVIGVIAFQMPGDSRPLITVTYTTHSLTPDSHWFTSGNSTVTYIEVNALFNSSKHIPTIEVGGTPSNASTPILSDTLNINDFYLTSNGQPLSTYILTLGNTKVLNSTAGFAVMYPFDFTVRGNVTSYQLAYNGTSNIKINLENP